MSRNSNNQVSVKATFFGIVVGAVLALLFAVIASPGLIGVGAAIGASMAAVLNEAQRQR